jgi:hypothetical protein
MFGGEPVCALAPLSEITMSKQCHWTLDPQN